jgi:hypothetical protein
LATTFAGATEGACEEGSTLEGSRAPIAEGDSAGCSLGLKDGAGMTVTTADGDGVRRWRDGDGDGSGGLGDSEGEGFGDGNGGITLLGELDGAAPGVPAVGFGLGLVVAVAFALGLGVGAACGDAARAGPMSSVGAITSAAPASRIGTRTPGTCEL